VMGLLSVSMAATSASAWRPGARVGLRSPLTARRDRLLCQPAGAMAPGSKKDQPVRICEDDVLLAYDLGALLRDGARQQVGPADGPTTAVGLSAAQSTAQLVSGACLPMSNTCAPAFCRLG
jgi:hypothetical protein